MRPRAIARFAATFVFLALVRASGAEDALDLSTFLAELQREAHGDDQEQPEIREETHLEVDPDKALEERDRLRPEDRFEHRHVMDHGSIPVGILESWKLLRRARARRS